MVDDELHTSAALHPEMVSGTHGIGWVRRRAGLPLPGTELNICHIAD